MSAFWVKCAQVKSESTRYTKHSRFQAAPKIEEPSISGHRQGEKVEVSPIWVTTHSNSTVTQADS